MANKKKRSGPYRKAESDFAQQIGERFTERMEELGLYPYAITEANKGKITPATLRRILKGHGGTNINTFAVVADILGLEIIIKPKEETKENEDKD